MDKITSSIKNKLDIFEDELKKIIAAQDNFLARDLNNFMFSNPKRLRPVCIFLFAEILKIKNPLVQDIALITELIHSASLIHDDIIDEEKTRRNFPSFYEKFGSKLAVLQGDLLLASALEKMSNTTCEISKIFARKIKKTIDGEIMQNENSGKITNIETYFKKTQEKTANLFFAGLEALFTLGDFDENLKNNLSCFLKNYTLAFQIKNDIDNFYKNSTDIKNGNYTLPVIYFFMENNTAKFNPKSADFEKFIEKSKQKIKEFKTCATEYLENVENSIYKDALIELTNRTA